MSETPKQNRVVITMDGGLVESIFCDQTLDVHLFDFDTESCTDPDEGLTKVENRECYWLTPGIEVSTATINRYLEEARLNSPDKDKEK